MILLSEKYLWMKAMILPRNVLVFQYPGNISGWRTFLETHSSGGISPRIVKIIRMKVELKGM